MTPNADLIAEVFQEEGILQIDGFDDCIVGYIERACQEPMICYDQDAMIEKIKEEHGCDYYEAREHFDFNIAQAWMGDGTPCFLTKMENI